MADDPRLDPHHDARLSELISDAADGVRPGEGLSAIRSRTRTKETPMSSSRNWLYAVGGAIAGTAAVIVAIAAVSQLNGDGDSSTPVAGGSTKTSQPDSPDPTPTKSATDTPTSASATAQPVEGPVPVYFAGDGPKGPVLFREFQPGIGMDPVAQAAMAAVAGPALDPDYRTLWPAGTQATASYDGDVITVDLSGADLHDRPSGMTARDAGLAVQQVVYSVQGAAQARAGVQLTLDGQRTDTVLGVPTSEPVTNAKPLAVLSQMSITDPAEGQEVTGGTLEANGVNNSFEATVAWQILDAGGQSVMGGAGMATGWGDKLYPWKLSIDVSSLAPGTYTFVAMNDDPSGEGKGGGPATDTRTIVVK